MTRNSIAAVACALALGVLLAGCGNKNDAVTQAAKRDVAAGVPAPGIEETKAIALQAYI